MQLRSTINYVSCNLDFMLNTSLELNDCIRNTTALCNPRQNSVQDKIQNLVGEKILSEKKLSKRNLLEKKILTYFSGLNFVSDCILFKTEFVSDFQCTF